MAKKRHYDKLDKEMGEIIRERVASKYGHINMLDLFVRAANINREGLLVPSTSGAYEIAIPDEREMLAVSGGSPVRIDRMRMIQNNER